MTTTFNIYDKAHKDFSQPLRLKDIAKSMNVKRSTLADWAMEFSLFLPIVKQGRRKYFHPKSEEILQHIRDLKENGYNKVQIVESLTEKFPIVTYIKDKRATNNTKGNRKRQERQDLIHHTIQSLDEVNEQLDKLILQVSHTNPDNKRLKEWIASEMQTNSNLKRIVNQNSVQHQRDEFDQQRESIEERDRDLLKQLRKTIEEKEKLIKKRSFFARIFSR